MSPHSQSSDPDRSQESQSSLCDALFPTHLVPTNERGLAEQIDFFNAMILFLFGMALFFAATGVLVTGTVDTNSQTTTASDRTADRLAGDLFVNGSPSFNLTASPDCLESFFNQTRNPDCGQTGSYYDSPSSAEFARLAAGLPSDFAVNITVRNSAGDTVRWNAPVENATISNTSTIGTDATSARVKTQYNITGSSSQTPTLQLEYRKANTIPWTTVSVENAADGEALTTLNSLTPATTYEYRALLNVYGDSDTGQQQTFTTSGAGATIETKDASAGRTTATLKANLTDLAGVDTAVVEFNYSRTNSNRPEQTVTVGERSVGSVSANITDLDPDTEYSFRPIVRLNNKVVTGEKREFTTGVLDIEVATRGANETVVSGEVISVTGSSPVEINTTIILVGDNDLPNRMIDAGTIQGPGTFSADVGDNLRDKYLAYKASASFTQGGETISDEGIPTAFPPAQATAQGISTGETHQSQPKTQTDGSRPTASLSTHSHTFQPTGPLSTEPETEVDATQNRQTTKVTPASGSSADRRTPLQAQPTMLMNGDDTQQRTLLFQSGGANANVTVFSIGALAESRDQEPAGQTIRTLKVTLPDGTTEFWTLEVTVWIP